MKLERTQTLRVAGGLAALLAAGCVAAAEALPREGSYDYTACWSGVATPISFSKTASAFTFEMTGTDRSNPPGGMFDNTSFRCVGLNASLEGRRVSNVVCEAVDRDGDKHLAYFALGPDGKYVREEIAGTGKYVGMVVHGKVRPLGPFPTIKAGTFQNCNHQTGTYKRK